MATNQPFPRNDQYLSQNAFGSKSWAYEEEVSSWVLIFPTTYALPQNFVAFKNLFGPNGQSKTAYIIKPDGSAQGKGIFLTKRIEDVENLNMMCVAQQYIRNPLLIDKKKIDLRIYVLTTSCSPLRIYLFRDGLVRICTEEYNRPNSRNMDDMCMHLTNYSVNKRSDKYERDGGSTPSNLGSKRSISWLLAWLSKERSEAAADKMWSKIGDICAMTIISILPTLRREYSSIFGKTFEQQNPKSHTEPSNDSSPRFPESPLSSDLRKQCRVKDCGCGGDHSLKNLSDDDQLDTARQEELPRNNINQKSYARNDPEHNKTGKSRCFEVLGFDIMIDNDLRPYLIEVNHLPSWGTDSPLDELIKSRVIIQALSAIKVKANDKRYFEGVERKQSRIRLERKQSTNDIDCTDKDTNIQNHNSRGIFRDCNTNKKQPVLFESNSAERRIRSIYEKYAPEKLSRVKDLMSRYRGY